MEEMESVIRDDIKKMADAIIVIPRKESFMAGMK